MHNEHLAKVLERWEEGIGREGKHQKRNPLTIKAGIESVRAYGVRIPSGAVAMKTISGIGPKGAGIINEELGRMDEVSLP